MDVMRIIYAIAKKYHRKYPDHDYWHFVGAGWGGYCDAIRLHDPEKSKFATFVRTKIEYAMREAIWFNIPYRTVLHDRRSKERWEPLKEFICESKFDFDFDQKIKIRKLLKDLPEKERLAIEGTILRGFSGPEIGKRLGVNKSMVSKLKKTGINRLKKRLKREGIN